MYFSGEILIDLAGTTIEMRPPTNFFGGVANLLSQGSWASPEAHETCKLMALAQATYRGLSKAGVQDAIRIAVGDAVIFEDRKGSSDDFGTAMAALRSRIESGLELDPRAEFDLVLAHEDDALHSVIDLDFHREHKPGTHPLAIRVTATSVEMRLRAGESRAKYLKRTRGLLPNQASFDAFRGRLEERFDGFLASLKESLEPVVGAERLTVNRETRFVGGGGRRWGDATPLESADAWSPHTTAGRPFYGFDPTVDLFYLSLWTGILSDQDLHSSHFVYVDPRGERLAQADGGSWSGSDFAQFDASRGGGGDIDAGAGHHSGGGGSIDAGSGHHNGGGGWLSSIADMFSSDGGGHDGGGHGGGGDVGGDGGGGSSCSSCGGGGGCGGGGCGGA